MKKTLKKQNIIISLVCLTIFSSSLGLLVSKKSTLNSELSSENEFEPLFRFEENKIKMRNIGDTYSLKVLINEDATYQTCRFIISDETALQVVSKTSNSITFRRIKDFENYVTVKAISDDPFSTLEDTCYVRCYNNFKSFEYLGVSSIKDGNVSYDSLRKLCDENQVILKQGLTYTCNIVCSTLFSYLNGEDGYSGDTNIFVEDIDMQKLKTSLQSVFNNTITSITQDLSETEYNRVIFTFKYQNTISIVSSIKKNIAIDDKNLSIELKKYVETKSFEFDENKVIL